MLGSCARASDFFRIVALPSSGCPHPGARIRVLCSVSPALLQRWGYTVRAHFAQ